MDPAQKERLGKKWVCYSCGVRFYDLKKPEPICPRCEADQRESPVFEKPKRSRAKKAARKATKKPKAKAKAKARAPDDANNIDGEDALPVIEADEIDPSDVVEIQVESD
jgi:hypothetical protein